MSLNRSRGRFLSWSFGKKIYRLTINRKVMVVSTFIANILTFFEYFNFPIYWPLLAMYFVFMTTFLCRYKLEHMIRYKYVPWDTGKK